MTNKALNALLFPAFVGSICNYDTGLCNIDTGGSFYPPAKSKKKKHGKSTKPVKKRRKPRRNKNRGKK